MVLPGHRQEQQPASSPRLPAGQAGRAPMSSSPSALPRSQEGNAPPPSSAGSTNRRQRRPNPLWASLDNHRRVHPRSPPASRREVASPGVSEGLRFDLRPFTNARFPSPTPHPPPEDSEGWCQIDTWDIWSCAASCIPPMEDVPKMAPGIAQAPPPSAQARRRERPGGRGGGCKIRSRPAGQLGLAAAPPAQR